MRPKGSPTELEARRQLAAKFLSQGKGIREVARRIGAAPSSVKRWKDAFNTGGMKALKPKPHTGRPPRLSPQQRQRLLRILHQGPRAINLPTDHWTCRRVGTIIKRLFGVRYHPDHISRILRALGWGYRKVPVRTEQRGQSRTRRRRWLSK